MSLRFAVVYEAPADFRTATELADRVLVEAFDWLDPEDVEPQRIWLGEHGGKALTWSGVSKLAIDNNITAMGFFDGDPAKPDAWAARRTFRLLRYLFQDLDGVMLVRDQDDDPEHRAGLEQFRMLKEVVIPVVVGLAVIERESWVICGFEPQGDAEIARLAEERQKLGFDPRLRSHELTAGKDDQANRSPKRVLLKLSGGDQDREQRCWRETSLEVLRDRGTENGLALFLQEIRARFAPLIGHIAQG